MFFAFLVFSGLYFAKEFLVPIAIASLLAMLFVPLCRWFESKNIGRTVSALLCVLVLILSIGAIVGLLSWQASDIANDLTKISDRITKIGYDLREFIARTVGISAEKQQEWFDKQTENGSANSMNMAGPILAGFMAVMIDTILVIVYLFLFICTRSHLKKFILMLVPASEKDETEKIIGDGGKVAQRYLSGMSIMIGMLWIMYGIGFSLAGVENALFFAVLCGILEIVPFIGNLTGTVLTLMMVISQGGDDVMIISVLGTYFLVQFIQTYILEPMVVGSEVNINPLFTILILVLMEIVWGIPGMILAIPILGIVKIVCDHIKPLKPYGFLIGKEKSGDAKFADTIKNLLGLSSPKKSRN